MLKKMYTMLLLLMILITSSTSAFAQETPIQEDSAENRKIFEEIVYGGDLIGNNLDENFITPQALEFLQNEIDIDQINNLQSDDEFFMYLLEMTKKSLELEGKSFSLSDAEIDSLNEEITKNKLISRSSIFDITADAFKNLTFSEQRRLIMTAATVASNAGLPVAGGLLFHACQNHPSDQTFGNGSLALEKIRKSPEYKEQFNAYLKSTEPRYGYHIIFESDLDLHLGFHKMNGYFIRKSRIAQMEDKYNYEWSNKYAGGTIGKFITFMNNVASICEDLGVINSYECRVLFRY